MGETIFENVGRLLFSRDRIRKLEKDLKSAGIGIAGDAFAGYVILNVLIIAAFLSTFLMVFEPTATPVTKAVSQLAELPFYAIWLLLFVALLISLYFLSFIFLSAYIVMQIENRRDKLETVLPDFLMLVSSNMKAGMTLDQAMWYAAKPEFGLLSEEVRSIIKSAFSGESLDAALDDLSSRFDSKIFERTILLVKQASATGGELTNVLERTAEDVRETLIMKKEVAASLMMYEIFVLFGAVFGAPFLFSVGGKLIEIFERISVHMPRVSSSPALGPFGGIGLSGPVITSQDFFYFSIPTIFVTCLVSSFIVSIIRTGTRTQGLKYFPFVLIGALFVYWLAASFLSSVFLTFS